MHATSIDAYQLLHKGAEALARAEWQGMRVDVEYCERAKKKLTYRIEQAEQLFNNSELGQLWQRTYGGKYNPRSDRQLGHILYDKLAREPPRRTESGEGSTDEEALRSLDIPELDHRIKCSKLYKMRDTYLDAFVREQRGGIIHPFFNLHLVKSYRSSSDSPNFQNIPEHDEEAKRICQRAIYPRPGHRFINADFASIEVVVAACYNKDPRLLEYLFDPSSDMHTDMAKFLFMLVSLDKSLPEDAWLRFSAKNAFVFAEFYGSYYEDCAKELALHLQLPSSGRWGKGKGVLLPDGNHISDHMINNGISRYIDFEDHVRKAEKDLWERRFPVYAEWRKQWYKDYEKRGYFDLLTGFRCQGFYKRNETINLPIQGSAFHCLLWTFIRVDEIMREEKWDSRLVGEVHDDMILDVHPDEQEHVEATIQHVVANELPKAWSWIIAPLRIDIKSGDVDGSLYTIK